MLSVPLAAAYNTVHETLGLHEYEWVGSMEEHGRRLAGGGGAGREWAGSRSETPCRSQRISSRFKVVSRGQEG